MSANPTSLHPSEVKAAEMLFPSTQYNQYWRDNAAQIIHDTCVAPLLAEKGARISELETALAKLDPNHPALMK